MKAKYYPHITAAGALLLTITPLCFVLSLSRQAPTDGLLPATEVLDARVDSHSADTAIVLTEESASERATPVTPPTAFEPSVPSVSPPSAPPADSASPATRVAMLPGRSLEHTGGTSVMSDASAVMDMALLSDPDGGTLDEGEIEERVPVPDEAVVRTEAVITPGGRPEQQTPPAVIDRPGSTSMNVTFAESAMVKTLVDAGSHFGATAHLAMRDGFRDYGRDNKESRLLAAGGSVADLSAESTDERAAQPADDESSALLSRELGMTIDEQFGQPVEAAIEDVILQQPLESRPVSRVENIVAVTKAKGWPVALVRSDLPDDHWWVQQMVGIRGNAFAARANFGNENSIRGSVYHLVFVFLDSPDEVRRFRIAKQFRELPEGIRRSREFTFTRR